MSYGFYFFNIPFFVTIFPWYNEWYLAINLVLCGPNWSTISTFKLQLFSIPCGMKVKGIIFGPMPLVVTWLHNVLICEFDIGSYLKVPLLDLCRLHVKAKCEGCVGGGSNDRKTVYRSVSLKLGFVPWGSCHVCSLFMTPSFKISGENWQNCSPWSFIVGLKPMGDVNRSKVILSSNIKTFSLHCKKILVFYPTYWNPLIPSSLWQTPLNNLGSKNCLTFFHPL